MRLLEADFGVAVPAAEGKGDVPDAGDVRGAGGGDDVGVFGVADGAVSLGRTHEEEVADILESGGEGGGGFVVGEAEVEAEGFVLS